MGMLEVLKPQQLQISDTLATEHATFAVEVPRRASKTTSIFLTMLGRCALRPGYYVTYSAQSGVAGMAQFREWVAQLEAVNPNPEADLPPWLRGKTRAKPKHVQRQLALFGDELAPPPADEPPAYPFRKLLLGAGYTVIEFLNGSRIRHIPPIPANFRGAASDVSWIDEAQEVAIEDGDDLLAAIRPLQDTRPGASIILSGTAGESRAGIFYKYLERGRAGDPAVGILDFAAPPATSWDAIEDEADAMSLLQAVHPGIGTLTTMKEMRAQWGELPRPQWAREYLSLWPETYSQRAISSQLWDAGRLPEKRPRPTVVAFGLSVKAGGSVAAIVAAWREQGTGYVEVVDHRPGTSWLPKRMQELSTRYRGSVIAFDARGEGGATRTEAERLSPKPRMEAQQWPDITAGSIQFLRDLERGSLKHFGQLGLEGAVSHASRRDSGDAGMWTWARMEPGDDITCLEAASRALRNWDKTIDRRQNTPRQVVLRPST